MPQLLFHLLLYETRKEVAEFKDGIRKIALKWSDNGATMKTEMWGLGPSDASDATRKRLHETWYQPFRHDIVGNTLCADLLDYLKRDPQRMGMNRKLDLGLLNFYVLKRVSDMGPRAQYSCAIDLYDHKRHSVRVELLNDIFRLLDLRHEIHEKAVMHRVVQSANAMLARGLRLLDEHTPSLPALVGIDKEGLPSHVLHGEDLFFNELLGRVSSLLKRNSDLRRNALKAEPNADALHNIENAERIFQKLAERRVYRPLMMLTGNQALAEICSHTSGVDSELKLRTLASILDSDRYLAFFLFAAGLVKTPFLSPLRSIVSRPKLIGSEPGPS